MSRWQRHMLNINMLMAHAAAQDRSVTIQLYIDERKMAEAISFRRCQK
jgi:hypothetical protein